MEGLTVLLAKYEKEIEKYLSNDFAYLNKDEQYKKCRVIAECCKLLGMTEGQEDEIIKDVRNKLELTTNEE